MDLNCHSTYMSSLLCVLEQGNVTYRNAAVFSQWHLLIQSNYIMTFFMHIYGNKNVNLWSNFERATADCLITFRMHCNMPLWHNKTPSVSEGPKDTLTADISFRFGQFSNCLLRSAAACDVALDTRTTLFFYMTSIFLIKAFCIHTFQVDIYIYILFF
jgi:hypothetical protein